MVSGKWNMAKTLPGGGGKRVTGEKGISQLHPKEGSGLCSCPQLGCLYAPAQGPSRSCPTAPGRLELLWIIMVGRQLLPMPELRSSSMNSHLPSLGEFSLSCGLTQEVQTYTETLRKTSWHSPRFFSFSLCSFSSFPALCLSWIIPLGF